VPNDAIWLIPNLGAEEGAGWPAFAAEPAVATTARLWRLLFGAPSSLIMPTSADGSRAHESAGPAASSEAGDEGWPTSLGTRPDAPVFAWLAGTGATPWLSDAGARTCAEANGLALNAAAPDVVARVHDKAFAVREAETEGYVPRCLRSLCRVYEPDELARPDRLVADLEACIRSWPAWTGGHFTLKPRFGSSGRGRVAGRGPGVDTPSLRGALTRLAARGGAILEPWLDRSIDLSVLLHIGGEPGVDEPGSAATVTLLGSLEQLLTPSGLYLGHLGELDSHGRVFSGSSFDEDAREAAAALVGRAVAAGYHGPCGVDGFSFQLPAGAPNGEAGEAREIFRPIVELNARFTAGHIALGLVRRALSHVRGPLGLEPGNRRAFLFALDLPRAFESWNDAAQDLGPGSVLVPLWREGDPDRPALLFAQTLGALHAAIRSERA
jgi:hypothetical protein